MSPPSGRRAAMFDVGFAELFLLALIGLLVLGPERLPKAARTLGRMVRKARTSWYALRRTIESELAAAEMTEPVKSAGRELRDVTQRLNEIHAGRPAGADPGSGQSGGAPGENDRIA